MAATSAWAGTLENRSRGDPGSFFALGLKESESVVAAVLGHAKGSVMSGYITIPVEQQIAALNRVAFLIDGDASENVVAFPGTAQKVAVAR